MAVNFATIDKLIEEGFLMDSRFNSPAEIASLVSKSGVTKSMLSLPKMILLGLMAGAFIAFGGAASDVAMHGVADVGLARVVAGVIFPVGLMLVVFTGSELFTGNCLMIIPTLEKKIKVASMLRNLVVVYISNFVGAMIIDLLIFFSGQISIIQTADSVLLQSRLHLPKQQSILQRQLSAAYFVTFSYALQSLWQQVQQMQ